MSFKLLAMPSAILSISYLCRKPRWGEKILPWPAKLNLSSELQMTWRASKVFENPISNNCSVSSTWQFKVHFFSFRGSLCAVSLAKMERHQPLVSSYSKVLKEGIEIVLTQYSWHTHDSHFNYLIFFLLPPHITFTVYLKIISEPV